MNDRDSRRSGGYLPGPGDGRTSVDLWGPYDGQSLDRQSAEIVACETSYVRARCAELGPVRSSASLMPPGTAGGREPMNLRVGAEAACTLWVPYWAPGWATYEFSRASSFCHRNSLARRRGLMDRRDSRAPCRWLVIRISVIAKISFLMMKIERDAEDGLRVRLRHACDTKQRWDARFIWSSNTRRRSDP